MYLTLICDGESEVVSPSPRQRRGAGGGAAVSPGRRSAGQRGDELSHASETPAGRQAGAGRGRSPALLTLLKLYLKAAADGTSACLSEELHRLRQQGPRRRC